MNTREKISTNKKTVEMYMNSFEKGDSLKVLSCLTDDVVWILPGVFHLRGKKEFEGEIRNDAFQGDPEINITRITEENDVVIAEGSVRAQKKNDDFINLTFCDVFEMQNGKIKKLISYLMEIKGTNESKNSERITNRKDYKMNGTKIKIETTISADVKKVWGYFNKPEHITKWNFAADDWHCPKAENDLRTGGKFKSRMEAKDGSFGFDFEGVYDEVIDRKKIAYTMADARHAVTEFEAINGKTKVTTTFDAENQNSIEMQRDGWQTILNNFKKYVEAN